MRKIFVVLALLLLSTPTWAGPFLRCAAPTAGTVTSYEVLVVNKAGTAPIDPAVPSTYTVVSTTTVPYPLEWDLTTGPTGVGSYTLLIAAIGPWYKYMEGTVEKTVEGKAPYVPFVFTKNTGPGAITGVYIAP